MYSGNVVLASGSPRRQAFLHALNVSFQIVTADIDETPHPGESAPELAARLAQVKARTVADRLDSTDIPALVIAADTVVALDGSVLGKPTGEGEAKAMLRKLRGTVHQVYSALSLIRIDDMGQRHRLVRVHASDVAMRCYSDMEIDAYVATGSPLDKAGAYALQDRNFMPVRSLDGCPASVVGLPAAMLHEALTSLGLNLLGPEIEQSLSNVCPQLTGMECCQRRQ